MILAGDAGGPRDSLSGLAGAEVDSLGAEVGGAGLLGCTIEYIGSPGYFEVNKTRAFHDLF